MCSGCLCPLCPHPQVNPHFSHTPNSIESPTPPPHPSVWSLKYPTLPSICQTKTAKTCSFL